MLAGIITFFELPVAYILVLCLLSSHGPACLALWRSGIFTVARIVALHERGMLRTWFLIVSAAFQSASKSSWRNSESPCSTQTYDHHHHSTTHKHHDV